MANIKVAVRVRPISEREIHLTGSEIVVHTEHKTVSLTNLKVSSNKAGDSRERTRRYGFDYCFDSSDPRSDNYAGQEKIYETLGETILDALFKRYNSCLVAYGQSASGKTYTMMGSKEDPGLTPRVCEGLFLRLADEEKSNGNFHVSVSYLEVYNERVRDLLKPSSNGIGLKVREHPRLGPYVQGLTHHAVPTLGSLISRVEEGTRARKTASTLQNPTSSRSHALLTLSLLPTSDSPGQSSSTVSTTTSGSIPCRNDFPRGSKLHLVDLAGSESAAACGGINRLKEGANINKSLVALGNVISALADRGLTRSSPGRRFIPYRDSALTWLLKDVLGGNATTVMLATISPASGSYNETSHTLRFAQRAQSVVNRPVINEDPVSRIIRELRAEVARLTSLLLEKNLNPDLDKPSCPCACDHVNKESSLTLTIENNGQEEELQDEEPLEDRQSTIFPGNCSPNETSDSENPSPTSSQDPPIHKEAHDPIIPPWDPEIGKYNEAKVSEIFINDAVDEPVFVDIPTLVAVLIKPEENLQVDSHQIEEICSEVVLEDAIDVDFQENVPPQSLSERDIASSNRTDEIQNDASSPPDSITSVHNSPVSEPPFQRSLHQIGKPKLQKQGSVDSEPPCKKSPTLPLLKKYGSIENLPRKSDLSCTTDRSQTSLDRRNVSSDRSKRLNNIKEVDDGRLSRLGSSLRSLGGWPCKDLSEKVINDSDKLLKDSCGKVRSQQRKRSIDGLRRKTSKDSSSSGSKDELVVPPCDKSSRKGSLDQEQIPARVHTPIQRARRAEIVAAVTERLYSSKKTSEDGNSTTASTPASEVRSPESTDVKLATATRMRLQEISRKMLAKRRKICVDTQTDNLQTLRVRDAASLTEQPRVISKDASVLTDRHEDYEKITPTGSPTLRVKEMSTLTDLSPKEPTVLCKEAGVLTDGYCEGHSTIDSLRNDSRIILEDLSNCCGSKLSSGERLESLDNLEKKSGGSVDHSTNTRLSCGPSDSWSQTRKEDLRAGECHCRASRCCSGPPDFCSRARITTNDHCEENPMIGSSKNNPEIIPDDLPNYCKSNLSSGEGSEMFLNLEKSSGESVDHFVNTRLPCGPSDSWSQTQKEDSTVGGCHCRESRCCSGVKYVSGLGQGNSQHHGEKNVLSISLPDTVSITIESSVGLESKIRVFEGSETTDERQSSSSKDIGSQTEAKGALETGTSTEDTLGESYFYDLSSPTRPALAQGDGKSFRIENIFHEAGSASRVNPRIEIVSDSSGSDARRNSFTVTNSVGTFFMPETRENATCMERARSWSFGERFGMRICKGSPTGDSFGKNTWPGQWRSRVDSSRRKPETVVGNPKTLSGYDRDNGVLESHEQISETSENGSRKSPQLTRRVSMISNGESSIPDAKSFQTVVMTDRTGGPEQDTNFSDDSLDPTEDPNKNSGENYHPSRNTPETKGREKACPPDLVAHTKKDSNETPTAGKAVVESEDFEDSQQILFPKTKLDTTLSTTFATPIRDFKSLILGDSSCAFDEADEPSLADSINKPTVLRQDSEDGDDDLKHYPQDGRSNEPKSIIKKPSQKSISFQLSDHSRAKTQGRQESRKRVHFAVPEVFELPASNSPFESPTSEDEAPRNVLEEYLDEAVIFMRNMNSMNEFMSAANGYDERATWDRSRCRGNFVEYQGQRISLDDEQADLNSDDEELSFDVQSYERCLRSMDRLEECLAKVKRHDEILRDSYGIQSGSTGARLGLVRFSLDPKETNAHTDNEDKSEGSWIDKKFLFRSIAGIDQRTDGKNNNHFVHDKSGEHLGDGDDGSSETLKRSRTRGSWRFSDVRQRKSTTYSQLRGQLGSSGVGHRSTKKDEHLSCDENDVSSNIEGPVGAFEPGLLQRPGGHLTRTKTKRAVKGHVFEGIKGCGVRQRFTLTKYDSSNESSSSNEALETLMETVDHARDRFKYPGSPRSKFLQLLSERRRIVEDTRNAEVS